MLDPSPDVYFARIRLPHIRERLQALWHQPAQVIAYINDLLLDTRDGQRRGFDLDTADALMAIKVAMMRETGELEKLRDNTIAEGDFKGGEVNPIYTRALPKNW